MVQEYSKGNAAAPQSGGGRGASSLAAVPMGKTLPNAQQLEGPLLGALMLSSDLAGDLVGFLEPDHFYVPRHQSIYKAIVSVAKANLPVDLYTVIQQLEDAQELSSVGGAQYVAGLTSLVASAVHAGEHAQIVVQKYIQRKLIEVVSKIQEQAYDGRADVYDLIEDAEARIFELHGFSRRHESQPIGDVIEVALEQVRAAAERKDGLSGISTGFDNLDDITQGWQKGNLIIIGGRTSMGKTAFVLSMARNMAVKNGTGVAIFSLEMSNTELALRLMVSESELDGKMVKSGHLGELDWQRLNQACEVLSRSRLYFDDTQPLSVSELRAKSRRLKARYDIGLVIVDYLQMMEAPKDERRGVREQDVSRVSRALKVMAKELDVPVIALAQLRRTVEERSDKRPLLSDLRESGSIEQDADFVAMVHREEYYKTDMYPDGSPTQGKAVLAVVKNRHGALGTLNYRFVPGFAQFKDEGDREDHYRGMDGKSSLSKKKKSATTPVYEARMSASAAQGDDGDYPLKMPEGQLGLDVLGQEDDSFGAGY